MIKTNELESAMHEGNRLLAMCDSDSGMKKAEAVPQEVKQALVENMIALEDLDVLEQHPALLEDAIRELLQSESFHISCIYPLEKHKTVSPDAANLLKQIYALPYYSD